MADQYRLGARVGAPCVRDSALMLAKVSELLACGAFALAPARMLAVVCEAVTTYFSMANAVLFKSVAGQSRTLVWSAPGVASGSRMVALQNAWESAADLVDVGIRPGASAPSRTFDAGRAASASLWDERLGVWALLYVESLRVLDGHDRVLLDDLLQRMLCLPS